ncbi:MAG TPA: class I SAM-dependent methyltransferase [Candidatus Limnocylindrales bacterium]|nr:class I SAM-dependent methyltransferase [Candidatus Limnocylindrales bacterium]
MTDQQARYDRIAEGYAEWWSPVHRPATLGLLDEIAPAMEAGATRVVDVGCGTGALVGEIAARWPRAHVTGVDISARMLAIAARVIDALPGRVGDRVTLVQAPAGRLPSADGAFDVATSAFVLQLVPSRFGALREARRVLAPDGMLATVTWMPGTAVGADAAYDDALVAAGLEPRGAGSTHDDPASPAVAEARLRRAGFARVRGREDVVRHRYTPEGYLEFVRRFDDEDLFASLDEERRRALEADLLARLRALPPDSLVLRYPVTYATGRRSARTHP